MIKRKIVYLLALPFILSSCKEPQIEVYPLSWYYNLDDTYVTGHRIFDQDYEKYAPKDGNIFSLDEFNNLYMTYENGKLNIRNSEKQGKPSASLSCVSFYIADIDRDDYYDICYASVENNNETKKYSVSVYSIHKEKDIFNIDATDEFNFVYDLDENENICVIKFKKDESRNSESREIGKFLRDNRPDIEWPKNCFSLKKI